RLAHPGLQGRPGRLHRQGQGRDAVAAGAEDQAPGQGQAGRAGLGLIGPDARAFRRGRWKHRPFSFRPGLCRALGSAGHIRGERRMSSSLRHVLIAAAMAAAGCAAAQAPAPEPIRAPSAFTLDSGHPRTPEQLAMQINHADLQIRVMPDTRTIAATATHEVLAVEPLERLVFELDRNLSISEIRSDQQPLPSSAWSNPDGRLTITLPAPAPADSVITVGVDYAGAPHVARNAPW